MKNHLYSNLGFLGWTTLKKEDQKRLQKPMQQQIYNIIKNENLTFMRKALYIFKSSKMNTVKY